MRRSFIQSSALNPTERSHLLRPKSASEASPQANEPGYPDPSAVRALGAGALLSVDATRSGVATEKSEEVEATFRRVAAKMKPNILAGVLEKVNADVRRMAFAELDLSVPRKQLRMRNLYDSLLDLAPRFQQQLSTHRDTSRYIAMPIFASWWGRVAVERFAQTSFGVTLESLPLGHRLPHALQEFAREDSSIEPATLKRLEGLEHSSDELDKLFVFLLFGGTVEPPPGDRMPDKAEVPRTSEPAAEASPESTIEVTTLSGQGASFEPSVASSERAEEATPVVTSEGDRVEPLGESAGLEPIDLPADLALLGDAVERYREIKATLADQLKAGRYHELMELGRVAEGARAEIDRRCHDLLPRLAYSDIPLPEFSEARYESSESVRALLREVAGVLAAAEDRRGALLREGLDAFKGEFASVDLPLPKEFDAIRSIEDLHRVKAQWSDRFVEERAYRRLVAGAAPALALAHLPPASRRGLYRRASSAPPGMDPAVIIGWLQSDHGALDDSVSQSITLLTELIYALLDRGTPIPHGAWTLMGRMPIADVIDGLARRGLSDRLAALPEEFIGARELASLLADYNSELPPALRLVVERIKIAELPRDEQIPRLAALALDTGADARTIGQLVNQLAMAGRHQEVLLVTAFWARRGREVPSSWPAKRALLLALVEVASLGSQAHGAIGTLLDDGSSMTHSVEDLIVLLYLASITGNRAWYDSARYRSSSVLQEASHSRPALVRRWLLSEMLSDETPEERSKRRRAIECARDAMRQWDHDIQKRSCYSGWEPYASRYQSVFRDVLTAAMSQVYRGEEPPDLSPVALVERASHGQPVVEGGGREAMLGYLEKQIERLRMVAEAVRFIGREVPVREALSEDQTSLRAQLEREAANERENPVMMHIYRDAMRTIHAV